MLTEGSKEPGAVAGGIVRVHRLFLTPLFPGRELPLLASPIPIGTSIVLIAVGAILAYAVEADLGFLDIQTAGVILMIVGILGLVLSILFMVLAGRGGREREVVEEVPVRRRERL